MALSTGSERSWLPDFDILDSSPSSDRDRAEMYAEDGEFVLSVEMPGFDPGATSVSWDEGTLYVAAKADGDGGRTYYRQFHVPVDVSDENATAAYDDDTLEVRMPITSDTPAGTEIAVRR